MAPVNIKVKCHSDTNNVEWLIVFSFHEIWCFSDYSRLNLIVIILNYEQELHTVKCTPKFCGIEKKIFVRLFFVIIIERLCEKRKKKEPNVFLKYWILKLSCGMTLHGLNQINADGKGN